MSVNVKFVQVRAKRMPKATKYKDAQAAVEEMFGEGFTLCYEDNDGDQIGTCAPLFCACRC